MVLISHERGGKTATNRSRRFHEWLLCNLMGPGAELGDSQTGSKPLEEWLVTQLPRKPWVNNQSGY